MKLVRANITMSPELKEEVQHLCLKINKNLCVVTRIALRDFIEKMNREGA